ncbi:MAG: anhydro-N-acetylmuramic acid kinase [Bacteroidota bacterium]
MSGTSLDGLDIAWVELTPAPDGWKHRLGPCTTVPYPADFRQWLQEVATLSGEQLVNADRVYGRYLGEQVNRFLKGVPDRPQLVASHGHTVFHQPDAGYTFQLGHGATIAQTCGLPTIADFRSQDVALGGQGAPLVPIGDELLFGHYTACLNLGGFANISYRQAGQRVAFDICPANLILNPLAAQLGHAYDAGGRLARQGTLQHERLQTLDALPYYALPAPKSLGREWLEAHAHAFFGPEAVGTPTDGLRTHLEHIAHQIGQATTELDNGRMLVTGGGVHNAFLIDRIRAFCALEVEVPEPRLTDFKEALIFALLGVLRMQGKNNVLSTVTGASRDHCAGAFYLP